MKQKSLASFFGAKAAPTGGAGGSTSTESSVVVKKRSRRVVDNDDDDDDTPPAVESAKRSKASEVSSPKTGQEHGTECLEKMEVDPIPPQASDDVKKTASETKSAVPVAATTTTATATSTSPDSAASAGKGKGKEEDSSDLPATTSSKKRHSSSSSKSKSKRAAAADDDNDDGEEADTAEEAWPKSLPKWKRGQPVPFATLSAVLGKIEDESGRLKIIEYLSSLYRAVIALTPEDLAPTILLTANKLAADHKGIELGIGQSILKKALVQAHGGEKKINARLEEEGDLGNVAALYSVGKQSRLWKPPRLTVKHVFKELITIANIHGGHSQQMKISKIHKLLLAAESLESKYLIRMLEGKMRVNAGIQSVLAALARAVTLTPPKLANDITPDALACRTIDATKSKIHHRKVDDVLLTGSEKCVVGDVFFIDPHSSFVIHPAAPSNSPSQESEEALKTAYSELPDFEKVVEAIQKFGNIEDIHQDVHLMPGIPVKPMLAKPSKDIAELKRFDKISFTCEYKYDGERGQIHRMPDGTVKIYSRNAEDHTGKYPDIIAVLPKVAKAGTDSFILDCEVVAWDPEQKKILPFQRLSKRARKNVELANIEVDVCLFAFDLLYLNNEPLLLKPFKERRAMLREAFEPMEGKFQFATSKDFADFSEIGTQDEVQELITESVEAKCEGLMVKTMETDATYEPSKRSSNWIKLKKDYLAGMGDTFDLVPIGALMGEGKRTGYWGSYLMACYDPESGNYESVCYNGTGILEKKEEGLKEGDIPKPTLAELHERMRKTVIPKPQPNFRTGVVPQVWFAPTEVWELSCADLSISPVHKGGENELSRDHPGKGIALRFPRFLRLRPDKQVSQATSSEQIKEAYDKQPGVGDAVEDAEDDDNLI